MEFTYESWNLAIDVKDTYLESSGLRIDTGITIGRFDCPQCFDDMLVCQVPVSESIHIELLNQIEIEVGLITALGIVGVISSR